MARVRDMQGTPSHLEYPPSDGKRRYPVHCIFHEGSGKVCICMSTQSPIYGRNCNTAQNCDYYKEKENDD